MTEHWTVQSQVLKMTRYECKLCPAVLAKAVEELNEPEDNIERLAAIDKLRNAFKANTDDLKLFRSDDEFILCFLRARKFDHKRALKMLINYHVQRQSWPEVFDKVNNPALLTPLIQAGCVYMIRNACKDGSSLFIGKPGKQKDMVLTDFLAGVFLTVEKLLENEEMQVHGLTVIQDMFYMDMSVAKQMGPTFAKRFFGILQDCMPVRLKSVNIVNEPTLFNIVFTIAWPFMKAKTKKRLSILGTQFEKLHEKINPSVLPESYAGTGPDQDIDGWMHTLLGGETNI